MSRLRKKKKIKLKLIYFISMIIIGMFISYKKIENSRVKINDKEFIDLIVNNTFTYNNKNIINNIIDKTLENVNPIKAMNMDYQKYLNVESSKVVEVENNPIIYLYNTHQSEEYKSSSFLEFSINPTVSMNDYILEDIFNKKGYKTIVEENSIKDILNSNNWNYANSYRASRVLLENAIIKYPTLKYFIDIHRDSLSKDKTTTNIDGKDYAKIIFIIGEENSNYEENLRFTEKINNKLNEYYPTISKGIYRKSGPGVNGIYNQDFSPHTILIEIGGYENNTNEVLNSTLAFSRCFMEVINE